MAEKSLKVLEDRLTSLERAIGPINSDKKIIDDLTSFNAAIQELTSSRDFVNMLFKRVPEIQESLAPGFVELQEMDLSAQREYILLMHENAEDTAAKLEQIQNLSSILNSEKIKEFRKHTARVKQIGVTQLDQLENVDTLSDEVADLVHKYNNLTTELSAYFVQLDGLITNLERKKMISEADM